MNDYEVDARTEDAEQPERPPSPASPKPNLRMNREVDLQSHEIAEKHVPPNPPSKNMNWAEMQEYLSLLTPEMWSHLYVYLYRLSPRIIRQLANPDLPKYIDCFSDFASMSLEAITNRHGGGKYKIECADDTKKTPGVKSSNNRLFECYFTIDETSHEPKLNYEELDVHARQNFGYINFLQHKGILDSKGQVIRQAAPPAQSNGMNEGIVEKVLGFVSKERENEALRAAAASARNSEGGSLQSAVGNILIEKMKQDDPGKTYTTMATMMSSMMAGMKDIVTSSKPANDTSLDKIIAMQNAHNTTVLNLVERIAAKNETAEEKGEDDLTKLEKLMNIASKLAEMGPRGGRRGWAEIALDAGREIGVPLLGTIQNIFALNKGAAVAPVAPTVPAQMPAFDPYRRPDLARQAAQQMQQPAQPQPQPAPAPMPTPMPNPQPNAPADLLATVGQYRAILVNALNTGQRGCDFADSLVGIVGHAAHSQISAYGPDAITACLMSVPELQIFGEARCKQFAFEFVNYDEILRQEGEEEDGGTEAAGN